MTTRTKRSSKAEDLQTGTVKAAAPEAEKPVKKKVAKAAPARTKKSGFACYVGPTILGLVQQNQIFEGSVEDARAILAAAIKERPAIARLIVDGDELAAARASVKTPGNRLYVAYRTVFGK